MWKDDDDDDGGGGDDDDDGDGGVADDKSWLVDHNGREFNSYTAPLRPLLDCRPS